MTEEFTADELKEVIRAARVFSPGLSEEKLQSLTELQARFADSGYLEVVSSLQKLERETGIPLSGVLETRERLLQENEELKHSVATGNAEIEALEARLRETEEKYQEVDKAIQDAAAQLKEIRHEQVKEEKQLADFKNKAAAEKQRIDEELAEYRRKVDVTTKEITTAGQIKQEVTKHGFSLELALGLAQEFAGYGNARERLAEALKKYKTFTAYLAAINEQGEAKKKTFQAEINGLDGSRHQLEGALSQLRAEVGRDESILFQLRGEIAEKGEIVSFYHRFVHLRQLMEYLVTNDQVTFHHCLWCGALFWILKPGKVISSMYKCSWCGMALVEADKNAYAAVAQPPGIPLRLLT